MGPTEAEPQDRPIPGARTSGPASTESATRRASTRVRLALVALVLLGLGLRWHGADFCLPHRLIADERVFANQLFLMRHPEELAHNDVRYGFYPHLVSRIAWLGAPRDRDPRARTLEDELALASADPLLLRRIVGVLSLLAIPATYLLARLFLRPPLALGAAALIAGSLLHVWYSAHARPHGAASGFVVLGVVGAVLVRRRGDTDSYLLAGAMIALSIAILQTGFLVLPVLLLAHLLRPERRPGSNASLLLAIALVAASFFAFYPHVFLASAAETPAADGSLGNWLGSTPLGVEALSARGFAVLLASLWHFDPLILLLTLFALVIFGVGRRRARSAVTTTSGTTTSSGASLLERARARLSGREDLVVVAAHPLLYLLVFGFYSETVQRYAIPLLPYAACLAVAGIDRTARVFSPSTRVAHTALALVVLVQLASAAWLAGLRAAPDTSEIAARWITEHLDPARTRIATLPGLELPLLRDRASLLGSARPEPADRTRIDRLYPWFQHQLRFAEVTRETPTWRIETLPLATPAERALARDDPRAYFDGLDADCVVIEVWDRPILRELRAELARHGKLVARISPRRNDHGEDDRPFLWREQMTEYEEAACWAWRTRSMRSLGTVVEIYRLGRTE